MTVAQALELLFQGVDFPFGVQEGLGERATPAPLADEVDKVREPALLGVKLGLLESQRFRDVRRELPDLLLDAPEGVVDRGGRGEARLEGVQDDLLDQRPADQQRVLAGAFRRGDAAVVAAGFPADLGHVRAAGPADEGAGQEVRREVLLAAALVGGKAAAPLAAGPAAAHLLASAAHDLPYVLRHDAERLVLVPDPLGGGFGKLSASAGAGIAPGFVLVPHPAADIFLIVQEPTDGGRRPAPAGAHAAWDGLGVEHSHDPDHGEPTGVGLKDPQHDGRFPGEDFKLVAFGSRPALLVQPRGADGDGPVAVGVVADGEAALLLADLAPERFLFEVLELELVEDAADLDAEGGLLVVAVEAIGDRDDAHAGELELGQHGEHEIVIAGQPGEVIDEHDLEGAVLSGSEEGGQAWTVFAGARLRLIGVDVVFEDREAALAREAATGGHLILDAFGALILGTVARVDGGAHR